MRPGGQTIGEWVEARRAEFISGDAAMRTRILNGAGDIVAQCEHSIELAAGDAEKVAAVERTLRPAQAFYDWCRSRMGVPAEEIAELEATS